MNCPYVFIAPLFNFQETSDLLLSLIGPQLWFKWRPLLEQTIRFAYLTATSLSNFQTLGEEYTGILMVNKDYLGIPSKFIRIIMIVIQCYGYAIISKLLSYAEQHILQGNEKSVGGNYIN